MKVYYPLLMVVAVLLLVIGPGAGVMGEGIDVAKDITSLCLIMPSEGDLAPMLDGDERTAWIQEKAGAQIEIQLPSGAPAGGLYLSWLEVPTALDIIEYDSGGRELARGNRESIYKYYFNYYQFEAETVQVVIRLANIGAPLAELRVFGPGELPQNVMNWHPLEKADLMLVAVHPGDELRYFGGALPYYALARGKTVQPVYMSGSGEQCRAALAILWELGICHYPAFMGLADGNPSTMADMEALWGKTQALSAMVTNIRKYKPDVIVSHDPQGEEGAIAHQLAAITVREAVLQAPVARKFGGSSSEFGTWQVKKLYLSQLETAQVTLNWNLSAQALGGRTPDEVARQLYAKYQPPAHAGSYQGDNSRFGLAMTALSADMERNDFFENVPGNVADPALRAGAVGEDDTTGEPTSGEAQAATDGDTADGTASDNGDADDTGADPGDDTDGHSGDDLAGQAGSVESGTDSAGRGDDPRRGKYTLMLFGIPVSLAVMTFCVLWVRDWILRARRRAELKRRAKAEARRRASVRRRPPAR